MINSTYSVWLYYYTLYIYSTRLIISNHLIRPIAQIISQLGKHALSPNDSNRTSHYAADNKVLLIPTLHAQGRSQSRP